MRIAPGPDGAGVELQAITPLRLTRFLVPEGEALSEVVLPVLPLRAMLQRHNDADFVAIAAVPDEKLLQIRSYSSAMTIAISAPPVHGFPTLPQMMEPAPALEASPCWLCLDQLAATLVTFRKYCPEISILPQKLPHPLLMRLRGDGFTAEVHLARLER